MSGRRFALLAALCLFVMFIAGNLAANVWLRSWRIDLTENGLYSLSDGTREVLDGLTEPVQLTLYYSRDAAAVDPRLQAYAARVREMLRAVAARGRGRVRFAEVNVQQFTEEEDEAVEAGLQPIILYEGADPVYFGLSGINAIDDRLAISSFDPEREILLEYEITRLIYELENPDLTRVGLITSLQMDPERAADMRFGPSGQSVFATEFGRMMDVVRLAPDFNEIPNDIDVLAIIHPPPLSDVQAFAVDQFILRHGRAFIALDPASMNAARAGANPYDFQSMSQTSSILEPMLSAWGVAISSDVVLDLGGALSAPAQDASGRSVQARQPLYFSVGPDQLDREDLMTAWLRRGVNFGMAGALNVSPREGVEATTLAETTGQTMRIMADRALMRPSPLELMRDWVATSARVEKIAVRLSGRLPTSFPDGAPDGAPPAADGSQPLTQSSGVAELVIVADTDFLDDPFYVDQRGGVSADNASFALNAIDVLSGSDALVSLRSRAPSLRRMERVEQMETDARRRIEQRQEALQSELQETEERLRELQAGGRGSGFFAGDLGAELNAEERAEMERFRNEMLRVRGELRSTERDLRSSIDQLEALVVFVNMWLGPILIAGAGLFLFWRRQRRGRSARA